ncbi:hypothetical protein ET445_04920 [Agromyces protaetiae]|uniref:Uncharacterized protein n=1 Tax=Agromyces protaetiae TaxID=2509455 RepID=A0A4P6F9E5_9MICO|nr:hypothetical protein [Agromyces protaetiae]QAY72780.1 hypothetical protein ET445_04920 [Agromyces protaetiae]
MVATSTTRAEQLDSIALEFLHNWNRGRRLIAVDSASPEQAARFADDVADTLREHGQTVLRISIDDAGEQVLRDLTIAPFRAGTLAGAEDPETVLVVDGRHVLDGSAHGLWNFRIWTLTGDELPHAAADVIIDATDEDAPTRYFYDYCKIPPSAGDRKMPWRSFP